MVQKSYPHVEEARHIARTTGDNSKVRFFGRCGGIRSGEIRRAEAQSRARLKALVDGTIAPKKQRRPTITIKRLRALKDWVSDPTNRAMCEEECLQRDTEGHFDICPID